MGGSCRCSHSSVPGWESSVTIVMDNDETDAQGRAVRWRTGSSLSDSAWPYAHRSLWDSHPSLFSTVCPGARKGTVASSPMSSSAFFHPYSCAPEPFLPWVPLPTSRVAPGWSDGRADTVVRDPNGQLTPTEALKARRLPSVSKTWLLSSTVHTHWVWSAGLGSSEEPNVACEVFNVSYYC